MTIVTVIGSQLARQIGANLRAVREQKGLNQRQLAGMLGVETTHISRWENGRHRPSGLRMQQICVVLEIDEATLLLPRESDGDDKPNDGDSVAA